MIALWFALNVAPAADLTPVQVVERVLSQDVWGFADAEVAGRAMLKGKTGGTSEMRFTALSYRYAPPLAKSVIRFTAPAELAGSAFLQVQNKEGDDDRFVFLPELKKSRRISGGLRSSAFMGTDFTFADLDNRDLRGSKASLKPDETINGQVCYVVEVLPSAADAEYGRLELWVRKDSFVIVQEKMYDKAKVLQKTLLVLDVKKIGDRWFVSRSRMTNHKDEHQTELVLDSIKPIKKANDDEFTVRKLEKI